MRKSKFIAMTTVLLAMGLTACGGGNASDSKSSAKSSGGNNSSQISGSTSSSKPAPTGKSVSISDISLANEDGKVYVKVTGTQANYTADDFKWAWGLKTNGDAGEFVDGKETPEVADFKAATFDATSKAFTVKYCLTDLTDLVSGSFYQVYGGTPESYANIPFENTAAAARDATRSYYLRTDQANSIVFDSIQPIKFTKASIVNVAADELPTGVTEAGPYIKFGGVNEANLTVEMIAEWETAGKLAGNFQRVSGGGYTLHNHAAAERFYKIEGDDVFFYCYIGFAADGEGWMTHFDCVSGNSGANLQFDNSIWGGAENTYTIGEDTYRVYADKFNHGGSEAEFWGCLGFTRNVEE